MTLRLGRFAASLSGRGRRGRAAASILVAAALVAGLAGCTSDPLADQYRSGDNKGYISGDFRVVEIPASDRSDPVDFSGKTEAGDEVSSADYAGKVLVVNFWYAACGPCRAEAADLEKAHSEVKGSDVAFLGVNTSDSPQAATAFAQKYGIDYPSLMAAEDGDIKLAFAERTPINATPTTLVLDGKGRVAARIIGQLPDPSVLTTLVRDAVGEL